MSRKETKELHFGGGKTRIICGDEAKSRQLKGMEKVEVYGLLLDKFFLALLLGPQM